MTPEAHELEAAVLHHIEMACAHWGLAPTHRRFELAAAVFYELDRAGKLVAERSYFDKNKLLERAPCTP